MKSLTVLFLSFLTAVTAFPLEERQATEYDYIVVGGGAAGLVVADRLSESGKSVLLIERGPPSTYAHGGRNGPSWALAGGLTRFDVPALCNQIWVDSSGVACSDIDQMAGCILGGGTAVNTGLFFKPTKRDWDYNFPSGWKSNDMAAATQKVFQRIPSTDTPSQDGQRYLTESYDALKGILSKASWKEVAANSAPQEKNRTFSRTPFMYSNGERGGPLATYLKTAKARSNFKLAVNTTVNRVERTGSLITGVNVTATGSGGLSGIIKVKSTGKVVLSAGTFGTSKILMRSAIGPEDMLKVVAASASDGAKFYARGDWILLPVGYNLQDHTNTDIVVGYPTIKPYDFYGAYNSPIAADASKYLSARAGPLAQAAPLPNTMAWEAFTGFSDGIERQVQWTARVEGSLGYSGDDLLTISQYLGTGATSRGRLSIRSNLNMAVTTTPYVKNDNDIQAIIKGVASLQSALSADSRITWYAPAAGQTAEQYVRNYFSSRRSNHWIGAAKMGTDDGRNNGGTSGSVVDTNTKVYGTNNLFVVDASIFPGHVTTNPSAPIMIVAEKAAEKILAA